MKIIIKNSTCIDPRSSLHDIRDIVIDNGIIKELGKDLSVNADTVIDGTGLVCVPGLIDVHVHFREPGAEHKETIASGIAAAREGGFVACVPMPNTNPPCDTRSVVEFILNEAARCGFTLFPCGTMTKGRAGKEIAEMADLKQAGVVCVSDDGSGVQNALLMRRVMEYASMLGLPCAIHAEDNDLSMHGVMHEGSMSTRFGLKGIPSVSECTVIMRDIELARLTGAPVHFQHISAKESVAAIRKAKRDGLPVTCEATPHHLVLTDASLATYDTTFKMNPPLRAQDDVDAVCEALSDGTIDMIATDHAPHHSVEKDVEITNAPFGCIGLETSLGVILDRFVKTKRITLERLVELMNINPARFVNKPAFGALQKGNEAHLTIVDLNKEWVVDPDRFKSKGRNCPFTGATLTGKARYTITRDAVHEIK